MSKPLEDEVNEELRRQQLKSIWDRFGIYIIGFALLIILSVGGNEIMNYLNNRLSQRESIAFDNALNLIEEGNDNIGLDQLIKLTESKTGYKGLAFFRLSSESLSNGNPQEALDYLKKASLDKTLTKSLRVFAKIKAGLILVLCIKNHSAKVINIGRFFQFLLVELVWLQFTSSLVQS